MSASAYSYLQIPKTKAAETMYRRVVEEIQRTHPSLKCNINRTHWVVLADELPIAKAAVDNLRNLHLTFTKATVSNLHFLLPICARPRSLQAKLLSWAQAGVPSRLLLPLALLRSLTTTSFCTWNTRALLSNDPIMSESKCSYLSSWASRYTYMC